MNSDDLKAWLLLMGFEVISGTNRNGYVYMDDHGLRCRIDFAAFISIGWIPEHPLNTRPSTFCVTPKEAFDEIKFELLQQ